MFERFPAADIEELPPASAGRTLKLSGDYEHSPGVVAQAVNTLSLAVGDGLYVIALVRSTKPV